MNIKQVKLDAKSKHRNECSQEIIVFKFEMTTPTNVINVKVI